MSRLIDADALDAAFTALRFNADRTLKHWGDRPDWCMHGNEIETLIKDAPTVEPKRGRWQECDDGYGDVHYKCSVCGEEWFLMEGTPTENDMYYCPRCGADMREGSEIDD
jgi:DNA-directed RNA polymerase subunit RPC12/RpoP